ncbi:hypothetical protein L2E82_50538 [Cichorium intybus]|nr:hypothetical protein L2E82_50538 [Cichorium intybus]
MLLTLLAVARESGVIELLSSINGDLRVSLPSDNQANVQSQEDNIVGLHLFKKQTSESSSRSCTLLTCTTKRLSSMRSVIIPKSLEDSTHDNAPTLWNDRIKQPRSIARIRKYKRGCRSKSDFDQTSLGEMSCLMINDINEGCGRFDSIFVEALPAGIIFLVHSNDHDRDRVVDARDELHMILTEIITEY